MPAHRRLCSTDSTMLQVLPTQRSTIGDRAFQWPQLKLEQSAASDKSRQLTTAVSARGENTPLRAVILTDQKPLLRLTICRQKHVTLRHSLHVPVNFCKVVVIVFFHLLLLRLSNVTINTQLSVCTL